MCTTCDLPQLSSITAVVDSKRLLLAAVAVGGGGAEGGWPRQQTLGQAGGQWWSVAVCLLPLKVWVEGGPSGLSVDMDDLMAMIMTQSPLG